MSDVGYYVLLALGVLLVIGICWYPFWWERRVNAAKAAREADFNDTTLREIPFTPLPVDPNNLPRVRNYDPKPGRPLLDCSHHRVPLEPGPVLWWPNPGPEGGVLVFCRAILEQVELKRAGEQ